MVRSLYGDFLSHGGRTDIIQLLGQLHFKESPEEVIRVVLLVGPISWDIYEIIAIVPLKIAESR